MLTLYYASATFYQAWRIKNVCSKITEQLAQQSSISFYALPAATEDGYDVALATSDRCTNRNAAKVTEILWLHGNHRGCCLQPMQKVQIMPWISFPQEQPIWLPFAHLPTPEEVVARLTDRKDLLHLLLELDVQPCYDEGRNADIVRIEDYGKLLAWKIDSHLAVLLETDVEHFTKLLITTFLQNNLLINDQLPLIRIESINYEGQAQPFELVSNHLRKCRRTTAELSDEEWAKHLEGLRSLCVLANQAIEYEYNKNRTEGKTGVIKPDLIPHEKKQQADAAIAAAEQSTTGDGTAKGATVETSNLISSTKTDSPIKTADSKVATKKEPSSIAAQTTNIIKAEAAAATTLDTKTPTATSSNNQQQLKLNAKPTEIKKPGSSLTDGNRFQTKLTSGSPEKSTTLANLAASTAAIIPKAMPTKSTTVAVAAVSQNQAEPLKASELEKIAAATLEATAQRQKSPEHVANAKVTITAARPEPVQEQKSPLYAVTVKTTTTTEPPAELIQKKNSSEPIASTKASESTHKLEILEAKSALPAAAPIVAIAQTTTAPAITAVAPKTNPPTTNASNDVVTNGNAPISASKDNTRRPSLRRNKDSLRDNKPLNILVYSDSTSARESAVVTLKDILETDMYTIYPMSSLQVEQKHWLENTALVVVCGAVAQNIGEILVDYFLRGGKVLSLCSDILHFILPTYRTAEVREHELVQFSYDKWQKVKMMHHIFCYQPSPVKKNFSTDSDDATQASAKKPVLVCPRSIELKDLHGQLHSLDVKVLGTEETWNTPSLLLANSIKSGGKAVFSQVHLETAPNQFEADAAKYQILKQNERIRLEIFSDLLSKHLNVDVKHADVADTTKKCIYQNAYFLGRYETKAELLEKLKEKTGTDKKLTTSKLIMKFCGKNDTPLHANLNVLPILIHSCPDDFSTVEYFDDLKTREIGRLVIYAPIVSSSMNVISDLELIHGIAVLPRQQTEGVGRSNNQWLSPKGCAMFSLQLHISLDSPLGSRLPLIQHLIGVAMVNTLKSHPDYKVLDIGLKWPNDIYANGLMKIGGLVVKTTILDKKAIVNLGCGINLDNAKPTHCVNDLISEYNRAYHHKLPLLKYEQYIAMMFNEIERLVDDVQTGDFENFYKLYYELWLHNDQAIIISDHDGTQRDAKIIGIDDYGYLKVKFSSGVIDTVQPDGNSFDMLKGLILPKFI